MRDRQAELDFAFNAVPAVTRLGKNLTARYFGRAPHHSYSCDCSTRGREGMIAAQRYPELFDMLSAIVDWVEKGIAPEGIIASDWKTVTSEPARFVHGRNTDVTRVQATPNTRPISNSEVTDQPWPFDR